MKYEKEEYQFKNQEIKKKVKKSYHQKIKKIKKIKNKLKIFKSKVLFII